MRFSLSLRERAGVRGKSASDIVCGLAFENTCKEQKRLAHSETCRLRWWRGQSSLSVVANGLDRAAFLGFFAAGFFLRVLRLLVNEGVTPVIVPLEIVGG